jgi:hypothetical protein
LTSQDTVNIKTNAIQRFDKHIYEYDALIDVHGALDRQVFVDVKPGLSRRAASDAAVRNYAERLHNNDYATLLVAKQLAPLTEAEYSSLASNPNVAVLQWRSEDDDVTLTNALIKLLKWRA